MQVVRISDVYKQQVEYDRIVTWDDVMRHPRMPEDIARAISEWDIVVPSPTGSGSVYNTRDKTWTHTPLGSLRASNHWNWRDKRANGAIACPTDRPIQNTENWAIGIWTGTEYKLLRSSPQCGPKSARSIKEAQRVLLNNNGCKA